MVTMASATPAPGPRLPLPATRLCPPPKPRSTAVMSGLTLVHTACCAVSEEAALSDRGYVMQGCGAEGEQEGEGTLLLDFLGEAGCTEQISAVSQFAAELR